MDTFILLSISVDDAPQYNHSQYISEDQRAIIIHIIIKYKHKEHIPTFFSVHNNNIQNRLKALPLKYTGHGDSLGI